MKTIKTILTAFAGLLLTAGCSDKETYTAQINVSAIAPFYYANNTSDTLSINSLSGSWEAKTLSGGDWCKIAPTSGKPYMTYIADMEMSENTTGQLRTALIRIVDTNHPDEAYRTMAIHQAAIRGDGSFGTAALVKRIEGTDGTVIRMAYDELHRPLTMKILKNDIMLDTLSFQYEDNSRTMTVNKSSYRLHGTYDRGYLPYTLSGDSYSVVMNEDSYLNMMGVYVFNIEEYKPGNEASAYYYLINHLPSHPDSIHNADSLKYQVVKDRQQVLVEQMELHYSSLDNRYQSVDANQLLLGIEHCNPFMLLSLYRYARNSNIISLASCQNESDDITVSAELNADKSVKTLAVKRHDQEIVYTFFY